MRAGGDFQGDPVAVRGRHLDLRAERSLGVRDRDVDDQVRASSMEELGRLDSGDDVQVARRPAVGSDLALPLQPDARAVLDAGRDLDGVSLETTLATGAVALVARLLDHGAVAAAARARLREGEQALALRDDAAAVADGTDHRRGAGLGAGPTALAAC